MDIQLKNAHLTRQLDLIPIEVLGENITIIGAGAIGSFAALSLAKMGFGCIKVIDFDTIEVENMNSQFYRHSDIGKLKVVALQELIKDFTGVQIDISTERYVSGIFNGIVISAVDSMDARRLIWEQHSGKSPGTRAIIDPRMGAETALMYVMNPMDEKDIKSYQASLYSNAEAVAERCTAKSTMYTTTMLAGLVAKATKDLTTGAPYPRTTLWSIIHDDFKSFRSNNELN